MLQANSQSEIHNPQLNNPQSAIRNCWNPKSAICNLVGGMIRPTMKDVVIRSIEPRVALPGGLVRIFVDRIDTSMPDITVSFNSHPAQLVGVSPDLILARVPPAQGRCSVTVSLEKRTGQPSSVYVGSSIATEVNAVGNPAADRMGNIYVASSGPRGASVPFSVYRIAAHSDLKEPFLADIVNATGIVIGPDDAIYISSRHSGTIYKSDMNKNIEKFAENLGIATGLALDTEGNLYVGDRSGPIHKIDRRGKDEVICEIEPSV
ncbi:MAG TPA: IPT/TIG domain-containing protein, partial [Acidobacteriota bacterium]|nr:IPT/TIG domain-containing protein [Acidobacteriota bacterium]